MSFATKINCKLYSKKCKFLLVGHSETYWDLTSTNKMTCNLPRHYNQSMYEMIDAFMGSRLIFHLPHMCDLMQEGDGVYVPPLGYTTSRLKVA